MIEGEGLVPSPPRREIGESGLFLSYHGLIPLSSSNSLSFLCILRYKERHISRVPPERGRSTDGMV